MAGHSDKKDKLLRQKSNRNLLISIAIATGIYILFNAYKVLFKGHIITTKQLFGFGVLSVLNYFLYKLIDSFRGSYWESYLIDVFGLNLAVEVLVNFHWKFWYLYLIYPGFFCVWAGKKIFEYVKTIGKENPDEDTPHNQHNQHNRDKGRDKEQQPKQKIKYVKV